MIIKMGSRKCRIYRLMIDSLINNNSAMKGWMISAAKRFILKRRRRKELVGNWLMNWSKFWILIGLGFTHEEIRNKKTSSIWWWLLLLLVVVVASVCVAKTKKNYECVLVTKSNTIVGFLKSGRNNNTHFFPFWLFH